PGASMNVDQLQALRLAIVATRFARRGAVTAELRRHGLGTLGARLEALGSPDRTYVEGLANEVLDGGITPVLLGAGDYPAALASVRAAPRHCSYGVMLSSWPRPASVSVVPDRPVRTGCVQLGRAVRRRPTWTTW